MKEVLEKYFDRLWPINRSLTGDGNRESLSILSEIAGIKQHEVPSGTKCFDWVIPPEWNVKDAYVKGPDGKKLIDFKRNNLYLLGYSESCNKKMSLDELKKNLHTIREQPDVIPYLTSYYERRWGFCLAHNVMERFPEGEYEVMIDSELDEKGSMTYGEAFIEGSSKKEILFSTYICHPSMANNELSGPLITSMIYRELMKKKNHRYSYRFLFLPETIGSIYYLSVNGERLKENLSAGFVVTCAGDPGKFTYKRSRSGNTLADRAAELVLMQSGEDYVVEDFFPTGSDERQYCSPGFNLPVGSLMRTRYGKYKEYHTSADNRDFISFDAMEETVKKYIEITGMIENNFTYKNKFPRCEPNLGKRGLYPTIGSEKKTGDSIAAMMWLLNLSDGDNDMISISQRSGIKFSELDECAKRLIEKNLIELK